MRGAIRRHKGALFLAVVLAGLGVACLDEPEPFDKEPAVKIRFFNTDSLAKINTAIAGIDTLTKHLNAEKTSASTALTALNAQLAMLNAQIAEGRTDLVAERDAVAAAIQQKTKRIAEINTTVTELAARRALLTKVVATINKGQILLSSIMANGRRVVFEDTADVYSLPLNMNASRQVYYFDIAGKTDSLELTYGLVERITSKSYIRLLGVDIAVTENYSFNDVQVHCKATADPCTSQETTINVYF